MDPNSAPDRITFRKIGLDVLAQFQLERGLLYTLKELFLQPGYMVRRFLLTADRQLFVKPVSLLILTTTLATFMLIQFGNIDENFQESFAKGFEMGYESSGGESLDAEEVLKKVEEIQLKINYLFKKYFNLFILLALPIYALGTFLFFRREKLYYPEHLVANMYLVSLQNIVFVPLAPFVYSAYWATILYLVISLGYHGWLYWQLFTAYRPGARFWRILVVICSASIVYFFVLIFVLVLIVNTFPIELPV